MFKPIVPTTEPEDNYGIGVSTIWAGDVEQYETALIDENGTHPVQRYNTVDDAIRGHWYWLSHSRTLTVVTQIGCHLYEGGEDVQINLVRVGRGYIN